MQNRTPCLPNAGQPLPDFTPVVRKYRHDGWTPTRQRAFIAALADTGSVSRAAALVNMSPEGAYYLRRQAGAESFRRAWEAALDFGVQRLKDLAFERAIEGELVPVMSFGKLIGYRRKTNDRLLMFCLRMNAKAPDGRRYSHTYFDPTAERLSATTPLPPGGEEGRRQRRRKGEGMSVSVTQPLAPTRLVSVGLDGQATQTASERTDDQAELIRHFDPVALTLPQIEALQALLTQAAETRRTLAQHPAADPSRPFVSAAEAGPLLETFTEDETGGYYRGAEEVRWDMLDAQGQRQQAETERALAEIQAAAHRTPEQEEAEAAAITTDLRHAGNHALADRMDQARARRRGKGRAE